MLTVGIDVGGTKTACVVTDAEDHILMHEVEPTEAGRLAIQLSGFVRRAVDHFAADSDHSIAAVGVALPGHVEPRTGNFRLAVNLGSSNIALGPMLQQMVGLPCYVEHDARSAAEWLHATAAEEVRDDLAYLSVGTGVSAGIVLDGRVLRGANGLAGEVGHVTADPDGAPCPCGLHGCLEVVAAGPAVARAAHEAMAAGRGTSLPPNPTAGDVFRAAAAGDKLAAEITTAVAGSLARAIRGLVLTLGVRHIVVGGGVAAAGEDLMKPLMAAIERERAASPLAEAAFAEATVELLSPHVEAGARGAAAIARQRVEAEQREGVGDR
jgi:glucokinase